MGEGGREGELCCSHAGNQKRFYWEEGPGLVSFCFFGSRRPDALWMFVFFGLLSARFFAVLLNDAAIITFGTHRIFSARRHDPPRWGRAGPTGTCTPMGAPPGGSQDSGIKLSPKTYPRFPLCMYSMSHHHMRIGFPLFWNFPFRRRGHPATSDRDRARS